MPSDLVFPHWPVPAGIQAFTTTRHTDIAALELPSNPILFTQVHGAAVLEAPLEDDQNLQADAVFTQKKKTVCAVRTADCLPLLVCDKEGSCVAAIHAGWRGLACGVIAATLEKLPVSSKNLLVWLGPAIGPGAFEVGEEVYQQFPENKAAFQAISCQKYLCDIYLLARQQLEKQGVSAIYGGTECTYTNREQFYSYRQKDTGRMLSVIWMS